MSASPAKLNTYSAPLIDLDRESISRISPLINLHFFNSLDLESIKSKAQEYMSGYYSGNINFK